MALSDAEVLPSLYAKFGSDCCASKGVFTPVHKLAATDQSWDSVILVFENNIKGKKLTFCGVWFGINIIESDLIQNP